MYVKIKYQNKTIQQQDDSINQYTINYEAHLQPLTNAPANYQLPTLYGFRDIVWTKF